MTELTLKEIIRILQRIDFDCSKGNYSLSEAIELSKMADQLKKHSREIAECCT